MSVPKELGSFQDTKFREELARTNNATRVTLFRKDLPANSVGAGTTTLFEKTYAGTLFSRPGDCLELEFYASYAANANGKSITVQLVNQAGTIVGIFSTGGFGVPPGVNNVRMLWNVDFYLRLLTGGARQLSSLGRIVSNEAGANLYVVGTTAANYEAATVTLQILATGVANNDVSVFGLKAAFNPGFLE